MLKLALEIMLGIGHVGGILFVAFLILAIAIYIREGPHNVDY